MRSGISISVSIADRRRLEAIVADRSAPRKHVCRARIVLLSAEGLGTHGIMASTGTSKTPVRGWQERFAEAGFDGVLRDRTRPPGRRRSRRIASATSFGSPRHRPRTRRATGAHRPWRRLSAWRSRPFQRIWKAHRLAPHRWRAFKLSNDPAFAGMLHDIVGLDVCPPGHAVVLSVDEKSQIQALERTQPGLPMKKGRGARP